MPPPISCTTLPPAYAPADLKPASAVRLPTTVLYENVSPGLRIYPFIFLAESSTFVARFELLEA